jgi:23S rRNA (uracil1939-C5)-methyltransferase
MEQFFIEDLLQYRQQKINNLNQILTSLNFANQNLLPLTNQDFIWLESNSRRRISLQINHQNQIGFFIPKTHQVIEVQQLNITVEQISHFIPIVNNFIKSQEQSLFYQLTITEFDNGIDLVFSTKKNLNFKQQQTLIDFAKTNNCNVSLKFNQQIQPIFIHHFNKININNLSLQVNSEIFIQATKIGLESIVKFISDRLQNFQAIADLYCGAGIYAFGNHHQLKNIDCFEGNQNMIDLVNLNAKNLQLNHKIKGINRDLVFSPLNLNELKKYQAVIINPPRSGAYAQAIQLSQSKLEKIIYVSCNPLSFVKDAKKLIETYFKITKIIAIDQFYATNHLELVAEFMPK